MGCALLGFLFLLAGLVLYLLYYVSKRDSSVYLTVDEYGVVQGQAFGDVPRFAPMGSAAGAPSGQRVVLISPDRLVCPACGYDNSPTRHSCKRCHSVLIT